MADSTGHNLKKICHPIGKEVRNTKRFLAGYNSADKG